jgi:hypothetical protein
LGRADSWGDLGDLVAVSVFKKAIENPIESILVRNPANLSGSSSALFRTFFNNPSRGSLRGIEAEARKNFGFLGPDIARYFSVGGNFTYIDAEVDRTEAELTRSEAFFGTAEGDRERFSARGEPASFQPAGMDRERRFHFDHPEWGTKVTLAFRDLRRSDAAGSRRSAPDRSHLPDRYLVPITSWIWSSQTWYVERIKRSDVKASIRISPTAPAARLTTRIRPTTRSQARLQGGPRFSFSPLHILESSASAARSPARFAFR